MTLNLGSDNIYDVMVGASQAQAVYLGSTKIWPFTPFTETNTSRSNQPVPANATGCYVTLIGGGGAGGRGTKASFTAIGGGGGGGGAGVIQRSYISRSSLGSTYSVSVGSGGVSGGASATSSTFTSGVVSLTATRGTNGGDGTSTTTGSAGSGGVNSISGVSGISSVNGSSGGSGGASSGGAGSSASNNTGGGAPGGGGGAGRTSGGTTYDGGKGGNSTSASGGSGGVHGVFGNPQSSGSSGGNASAAPGGGGGGGASGAGGNAGSTGGDGGTYGAGGGGGGSGDGSGTISGGDGGPGYTRIEWVGQTIPSTKPGNPGATGVTYDAVNSTGVYANSTFAAFTHTATAGAYVIVAVGPYEQDAPSTVSYGGTAMTLLGQSTSANYGWISFYGLNNVPGGTSTILVGFGSTPYAVISSISFNNVTSVGTPAYVGSNTSATLSQSVSCSSGQMIVQGWGYEYESSAPTLSGGTNAFLARGSDYGSTYGGLALNYADSSTTFTTSSVGYSHTGIAIVLS